MTKTLEAVFDGTVLRPTEPLELEPNTRVRVVVETLPQNDGNTGDGNTERPKSFLRTAASLNLQGPPDWSENIDKYLYGDEPRSDG